MSFLCCSGGDDDEPRLPDSSNAAWRQAAELRGQLPRIMPPLEVDWAADATINTTRLPSRTAAAGARPQSPLGVFERRPSMRLDQHPDLGLASPFQQGGAAGPPGGEHGAQRLPSGKLQWTDSRKPLEAAIAIEQLDLCTIHEEVPATNGGRGWGWGGGGWGDGALDAAEQRLQSRLFKLKLEHVVMEGDGNCQFRSMSWGLYGTPRHHGYVRRRAVEYMVQRRDDFQGFLGEEFGDYIAQMSQEGTWGDELTLRAACEALGVVVNVVTSDAECWFLRYLPRSTRPKREIFMTYIAPLHYNAIRRANTGDRLRRSFGRQHHDLARAVSTYQRRYGLPETPEHVLQAAAAGG